MTRPLVHWRLVHWIAVALIAFLAAATPLRAQELPVEDLPEPMAGWQAELDRISGTLTQTAPDDRLYMKLRQDLDKVQQDATKFIEQKRQELEAVKSQLDKLGPAPKEGEPPESETAAQVRKELSDRSAKLDGAIRTAQVLRTRATQLSDQIQEQRRTLFSQQLFKRVQSPLTQELWVQVSDDAEVGFRRLNTILTEWRIAIDPVWFLALVALAAGTWIGLNAVAMGAIARYRTGSIAQPPPFLKRAASATGVTLARAAPPVAAAVVLAAGLWAFDMLPGRTGELVLTGFTAFSVVMLIMALVTTVLAPRQRIWRIFPASDANAQRLRLMAWGLAAIWGIDLFLDELNNVIASPISLTIAQSFLASVAFSALLAVILWTPLEQQDSGREARIAPKWRLVRVILWVLVFTILTAASLGYIALARFVAAQVVVTGSILALAYLLHITIVEIVEGLSNPESRSGRWLSQQLNLPRGRHMQAALLLSFALHALLFLVATPLVLLQWGFGLEDMETWLSTAFFGFEFGDWTISLATILVAILLFALGLFVTRLLQRWMDVSILERAQFDQGARSAVRTAFGYIGVAVAGVIAVSYAGLDFSSVAIVAGALSVGIGFGLQSIVNNFVSGLIILAERRISVGDWIVVGTEEGYVRRISVRATEIETFDRNFVIIPNADLISHTVKNWTFQHRRARIIIEIGVAYDSDPEEVERILLECAASHPAISDYEETGVYFENFGDNALVFTLRTYVYDVSNFLSAQSELRFAIIRAFRENGILIPFPQRDLHLKNIEQLEKALRTPQAPQDTQAASQPKRTRTAPKKKGGTRKGSPSVSRDSDPD